MSITLEQILPALCVSADASDAYKAGYDCGRNGATTGNCHFRFFATSKLKGAWEAGKHDADMDSSND